MPRYSKKLKIFPRRLRKNMTDAELILWSPLRRKQITGLQFYRQKPIGKHIVDFYCYAASLVIEVDGGQHYSDEGKSQDEERTRQLCKKGLTVLRFSNLDVLQNLEGVLRTIYGCLDKEDSVSKSP